MSFINTIRDMLEGRLTPNMEEALTAFETQGERLVAALMLDPISLSEQAKEFGVTSDDLLAWVKGDVPIPEEHRPLIDQHFREAVQRLSVIAADVQPGEHFIVPERQNVTDQVLRDLVPPRSYVFVEPSKIPDIVVLPERDEHPMTRSQRAKREGISRALHAMRDKRAGVMPGSYRPGRVTRPRGT